MTTRYFCPLLGCGWKYDPPSPLEGVTVPPARQAAFASLIAGAAGGALHGSVFAATAAHMLAAEEEIETHLRTHTLLEWVTAIMRLREANDMMAIALSDGGQIGAFIRSAVAPGSPVAQSRLDLLELLRRDSLKG